MDKSGRNSVVSSYGERKKDPCEVLAIKHSSASSEEEEEEEEEESRLGEEMEGKYQYEIPGPPNKEFSEYSEDYNIGLSRYQLKSED